MALRSYKTGKHTKQLLNKSSTGRLILGNLFLIRRQGQKVKTHLTFSKWSQSTIKFAMYHQYHQTSTTFSGQLLVCYAAGVQMWPVYWVCTDHFFLCAVSVAQHNFLWNATKWSHACERETEPSPAVLVCGAKHDRVSSNGLNTKWQTVENKVSRLLQVLLALHLRLEKLLERTKKKRFYYKRQTLQNPMFIDVVVRELRLHTTWKTCTTA